MFGAGDKKASLDSLSASTHTAGNKGLYSTTSIPLGDTGTWHQPPSRCCCSPAFGLARLQFKALLSTPGLLSTLASSKVLLNSSSLSVWSSGADSLADCSDRVRLRSVPTSLGRLWTFSVSEVVTCVSSTGGSVFPSLWLPSQSFCFCSCSFCRLRCFFRNLALRFLNQTLNTINSKGENWWESCLVSNSASLSLGASGEPQVMRYCKPTVPKCHSTLLDLRASTSSTTNKFFKMSSLYVESLSHSTGGVFFFFWFFFLNWSGCFQPECFIVEYDDITVAYSIVFFSF